MLNSDSSKLYIIIVVVTDIVLLLTMLVGLFRWRSDGGGRFGIGGLLWKQVGVTTEPSFSVGDMFSVHKGVVWFLVATVAEVPPAVSPACSLFASFSLMTM